MRPCALYLKSQNKLMTDYTAGPGGSLNSPDLILFFANASHGQAMQA